MRGKRSHTHEQPSRQPPQLKSPRFFIFTIPFSHRGAHDRSILPPGDAWVPQRSPKLARLTTNVSKDITVLPPPRAPHPLLPHSKHPCRNPGQRHTAKHPAHHASNQDDRLLVIVGPCSIHNPEAALDYACRLADVREQYKDTLEIVMRVYFEKPRTTVGWKGLINDPYLDGSYRIDEGLRMARQLLIDINRLGVPAASEFLDVISPRIHRGLISWGAIGARTTESQVHRELASGISAPIRLQKRHRRQHPHRHRCHPVASRGAPLPIGTQKRPSGHRPHRWQPRLPRHPARWQNAQLRCRPRGRRLRRFGKAGLPATLMVDCSHANSHKQHERQKTWRPTSPSKSKAARAKCLA